MLPAYIGRTMGQLQLPATADHPSSTPQLNAKPASQKNEH